MRRAVILANGEIGDAAQARRRLEALRGATVIAANGGSHHARPLGLNPDLVIGDLDSLAPRLRRELDAAGARIEEAPARKDETDLELALLEAVRRGADAITLIGAACGRLDHMLANFYLLAMPDLRGLNVRAVSGSQALWLAWPGEHVLHGAPGDLISLIPVTPEASDIVTEGLEYPLRGETLHVGAARGVSNVMLGASARFTLGGGLLFVVHTMERA